MFDDVRRDLVCGCRRERPSVAGGSGALRIGCGLTLPLLLFLWLTLHERTSPPPTPTVELGADRPALLWRLGTPHRTARAPAAFAPASERRPSTKLIADLRGLVVAADLPRGLEFPEADSAPAPPAAPASSAPAAAGGPVAGFGAVVPPAARPPLLALLAGVVWAVVRGLAAVPGRLLRACEELLRTPAKPVRRVAAPPLEERFAILQQLLAYQQAGVPDRDVQQLAAATSGLSRSQLNQLVTRAAKAAFGQGRSTISSDDLRLALRTAPAEDASTAYSFASMATAPQGSAKPSTPPWQRTSKAPAKDLLLDRTRARNLFAETLRRVALPALLATVTGYLYFDNLSLFLQSSLDPDALRVLGRDESQFMQNFQTVIGLLFSILAGNAYSSLYAQQENIYFALFQEVSEAKSLLEQVTLVCQGRPMYGKTLRYIKSYVENDLRKLEAPPAELLSGKPSDDPLESIMYLTSVGVPSVVYETVKSLRQARAYRLGAMQRKFPFLGIVLLYVLAILVVIPFPLLSAGALPKTATNILWIQSSLFGFLAGSIVLCLRIIQELWQSSGGVFNVDEVLLKMVSGLQEELDVRSSGLIVVDAGPDRPALPRRVSLDLSAYPPTWPKAAAEDGRPPPPLRPDGPG